MERYGLLALRNIPYYSLLKEQFGHKDLLWIFCIKSRALVYFVPSIDGHVPSDRSREKTILLNIPLPLFLPICIVAGLGVILAIGVLVFNIYHRNER